MNTSPKSRESGIARPLRGLFRLIHNLFQNFEWASLVILAILPLEAFEPEGWPKAIFGLLGAGLFLAGLALRLWSRGYEKNGVFVLEGPYRFVQNPDEVGSLLLYVGAYLMVGVIWSWVLCFALLVWAYFFVVSSSYEARLRAKAGKSFARYRQRVRRWIPTTYPALNRSRLAFNWNKAFRQELSTWFWMAGLVFVLICRKWLMQYVIFKHNGGGG